MWNRNRNIRVTFFSFLIFSNLTQQNSQYELKWFLICFSFVTKPYHVRSYADRNCRDFQLKKCETKCHRTILLMGYSCRCGWCAQSSFLKMHAFSHSKKNSDRVDSQCYRICKYFLSVCLCMCVWMWALWVHMHSKNYYLIANFRFNTYIF